MKCRMILHFLINIQEIYWHFSMSKSSFMLYFMLPNLVSVLGPANKSQISIIIKNQYEPYD